MFGSPIFAKPSSINFQFSLLVSPQTLQSEHSIYFTKINVARKPKRNQYSLYYLGSPVTIIVVRWHSVSNSKDELSINNVSLLIDSSTHAIDKKKSVQRSLNL